MQGKQAIRTRLIEGGVIPIIRCDSSDVALRIAAAIHRGGIPCVEVTLTTPGALQVIEQLSREFGADMLIGAGSVLDAVACRLAMDCGARFIVSPNTRAETLQMCLRYGVVSCPGALTPTEILTAWEQGGDLIKVFPCHAMGGAGYIKAVKAPLPQVDLVPTGGVELHNTAEFIKAGATAVAVGSSLMEPKALATGDYGAIADLARRFIDAVREARG